MSLKGHGTADTNLLPVFTCWLRLFCTDADQRDSLTGITLLKTNENWINLHSRLPFEFH